MSCGSFPCLCTILNMLAYYSIYSLQRKSDGLIFKRLCKVVYHGGNFTLILICWTFFAFHTSEINTETVVFGPDCPNFISLLYLNSNRWTITRMYALSCQRCNGKDPQSAGNKMCTLSNLLFFAGGALTFWHCSH